MKVAQDFITELALLYAKKTDMHIENKLKDAFEKFYFNTTTLKKPDLTKAEIERLYTSFSENFFDKTNSSRLQAMRHTAMIILDNIEELHKSAATGVHVSKKLFDEYHKKNLDLPLVLSDASDNEAKLIKHLGEFLEKTSHQIVIHIRRRDLIHLELSPEEDQRMRLLASASGYLHSLIA